MEINLENQRAQSRLKKLQTPFIHEDPVEADEPPGAINEPVWLSQSSERVTAEHRISELMNDLYTSLHLTPRADQIQAEAEAARERVLQLERRLEEAGESLKQETAAREAAETRSLEAKHEARELEYKIAKLPEIEEWVKEIGAKWIEEAEARKSAERRADALEIELKRIQSILEESKRAIADLTPRIDKESKSAVRRSIQNIEEEATDPFPSMNSKDAVVGNRENVKAWTLRILIGACLMSLVYATFVFFLRK